MSIDDRHPECSPKQPPGNQHEFVELQYCVIDNVQVGPDNATYMKAATFVPQTIAKARSVLDFMFADSCAGHRMLLMTQMKSHNIQEIGMVDRLKNFTYTFP